MIIEKKAGFSSGKRRGLFREPRLCFNKRRVGSRSRMDACGLRGTGIASLSGGKRRL
jgi:hypothetical protein